MDGDCSFLLMLLPKSAFSILSLVPHGKRRVENPFSEFSFPTFSWPAITSLLIRVPPVQQDFRTAHCDDGVRTIAAYRQGHAFALPPCLKCFGRLIALKHVVDFTFRTRIACNYSVSGEHSRSLKTACVLTTRMPMVPRS